MNELQAFEKHLRENEKSPATIEKIPVRRLRLPVLAGRA